MAKAAGRLQLMAVLLCVLLSVGTSERRSQRFSERAQQCRLEKLNTQQPSTRIESEGGVTEIWDSKEDQFQCAGVGALRNVLQPNSLALPRFHPAPQLVYVEQGEGLMGLSFPGCPETFHSHRSSSSSRRRGGDRRGERGEGEGEGPFPMSQERDIDLHQKIHRVRRGDIIAIPAGTVHWWYNDGNEEFIDVVVTDLNNQVNQLDQTFRSFELAGGMPEGQRGMRGEGEEEYQNVLSAFDKELLSESFNVPEEIVERMQRQDQQRGLIVRAENMRGVIIPDEGEEEEEYRRTRGRGSRFSPRHRRGSRWWEPRQEEGEEEGYRRRERGSHQLRPREEEEGYDTRERGSRSPRRTREEEEEEEYGPRRERGSRYSPRERRGSRWWEPRRQEGEEEYGTRRREEGSRYSPRERRGSRWWEPRRQGEEEEKEYGPRRERGSRYTPRTHGQTTREERQEEEYESRRGERGSPYSRRGSRGTKSCRICCEEEKDSNGLEETICTAKIRHNLNTRKDVDVYTHRAGRLNVVNEHKLPILRYIDMSAEKANIAPNALYSPHWSINSHTVVYVTRGQADVQIVGPSKGGQRVMDERVSEGDMFVIPQFFLSTCRAGRDGFEFVSFKTTSSPMKSPLAGYTSVFRAMPLQVISNAYQISPSDAQELKLGREGQSFFLSPLKRSRRSN